MKSIEVAIMMYRKERKELVFVFENQTSRLKCINKKLKIFKIFKINITDSTEKKNYINRIFKKLGLRLIYFVNLLVIV